MIGITYTNAACSHSSSNGSISEAEQKANTQRCFPVRWHPWGEKNPRTEWFNSYMVQAITQSPGDASVLDPQVKTSYSYGGGVAWGKVDDALVPKKDRTWSVLRGYETTSVTTGTDTQTAKTTTRYLRGTGETVSVDTGITDRTVDDHERFAGAPLVTTVYNGADGAEPISKTITIPSQTETARTGTVADGDLLVATRATRSDVYSAGYDAAGRLEHVTRQDSRFNEFGMVTQADDFGAWSQESGANDASDDLCTRTTYLGPTASGHVVVPQNTETVSVACATSPSRPDDVVAAMRMVYDDKAYGEAPTKGLVTSVTALDPGTGSFTSSSPVTRTDYDTRGRAVSQTDALGRTSETAYTNPTGVVTEVSTTTPDPDGTGSLTAHVTTTTVDPLLGVPLAVNDPNGKRTTAEYDAAGRLTAVWYPDRAGKSASAKYAYKTTRRGVNAVTTDTLAADGSSYHRSTQIFDGLLRQIQTQSESLDGHASAVPGRVVVDTAYDSYGRVATVSSPWFARGNPSTGLLAAATVTEATTVYKYDGAGRATDEILFLGEPTNPDYEAWRTTTHYDGATTTVVPPKGGVPTQTIVDARGRTTELRQYERSTTSNEKRLAQLLDLDYQAATYAYDVAGRLETVLDAENNTWSYEYDRLGRQTSASDPDSGTTTTTYDKAGQVTSVTDATDSTLAYTYDALGRRTSARDGSLSGAVRAKWFYDAYHAEAGANAGTVLKGQATASVRVVDGEEYVTALTKVDAAYRPTGAVTVVPEAAGLDGLSGRYESATTYTADGQVESQTYAAAGNLRKETVTTMYNSASMPEWMSGGFGWGTYVATSRFDAYGRLGYMDLGNTYGTVATYEYEPGTNRLTNLRLDRERIGGTELDLRYAYDPAGNVLSLKDVPSAPGRAADKQCFAYDELRRLTEAWTPGTGDCGLARSIPGLGGAAPYWTSWEYDGLGNRTSETHRTPGQDGGLVTTTDYTYGGSRDLDDDGNTTDAGEFAGPHAVTGLEVSSDAASSEGTVSSSYSYDAAGRMVSQSTGTDYERTVRSLDWDRESELAGVSTASTVWPEPEPGSGSDDDAGDPGGDPDAPDPELGEGTTTTAESSNVYTADGDRLLRTGPDGSVTLYVGGQEVTRSASGVVSAVRYYSFAGQTVAMRTAPGLGGVTTLVNDPHGTAVASVHNTNWTTTSVDKHYTLPFGGARGGAEMPGDRAFLGKTKDASTGLTLVGARWYDETLGRFLTVDPRMDLRDPRTWNAYAYANSNPLTYWDPSGLSWWGSAWSKGTSFVKGWVKGYAKSVKQDFDNVVRTIRSVPSAVVSAPGKIKTAVVSAYNKAKSCGSGSRQTCAGIVASAAVAGQRLLDPRSAQGEEMAGNLVQAATAAANGDWEGAGEASGRYGWEGTKWSAEAADLVVGTHGVLAAVKASGRVAAEAVGTFAGTAARACSFAGATLVLMADGLRKQIEDIEVGDEVIATDPETGEQEAKQVEQVFVHYDTIEDLALDDGTVIATTEDHPFWSVTDHRFERADELTAGEQVLTAKGHTLGVGGFRFATARSALAYNLAIGDIHTYHVGEADVLVHNRCIHASVAYKDWANKGAHVHVGNHEVRIFPDGQGGIGAEPIRLRNGVASDKEVKEVLDAIGDDPSLRKDIIAKATSARDAMNAGDYGTQVNRAAEIHFLIKALEKMG